jgi:hypothetical protein
MSHTAYPTGAEISAHITAMGGTPPAGDALTNLRAGVIGWWEDETRFHPFLIPAATADSSKTFDGADLLPSGYGFLNLRCGFYSITSVTVNDTAQVANTNYWAMRDHPDDVPIGPITWLKWPSSVYACNALVITGQKGYGPILPDRAYLAILDAALLQWQSGTAGGAAGASGITEKATPSARIKYGAGADSALGMRLNAAQGRVDNAVSYYRLKGL